MIRYAVVTVSDGVFHGVRADLSGGALRDIMSAHECCASAVVPDEVSQIQSEIKRLVSETDAELILTTGGTGLGPRDVTPQATLGIAEYEVPGLAELMRAETRAVTPFAVLSRGVVAVYRSTLIVNLPGSPRGVQEMLPCVLDILPHATQILKGNTEHKPGGAGAS